MTTDSKAYHCTRWGCPNEFGSVNDWKRHELSDHNWPEMWRSNEGRVFYDRRAFEAYLESERHIDISSEGWKEYVEDCHIGAWHQQRFWCGYCREIVVSGVEGLDCIESRFQHILYHGKSRTNWVSLMDPVPREFFVEQTFSRIFKKLGYKISLPIKGILPEIFSSPTEAEMGTLQSHLRKDAITDAEIRKYLGNGLDNASSFRKVPKV